MTQKAIYIFKSMMNISLKVKMLGKLFISEFQLMLQIDQGIS